MAKPANTIARNIFLAQLVGLPVIGIMALIIALIGGVYRCDLPGCETSSLDYSPALITLVLTLAASIPLGLYLKGDEKLAIRISQLLWIVPAVTSGFYLVTLLVGLSVYAALTDGVLAGAESLIPIIIFGALIRSSKEMSPKRPPTPHHLIAKGIFVTQLAVVVWLAASSSLGSWGCDSQQACDANQISYFFDTTSLASIGLLIISATGLIAWLRNNRTLSVRLSRLSLIALALFVLLQIYDVLVSNYRAELLSFYGSHPASAFLTAIFAATPLALLVFIHRYKQAILEG